MVWCLPESLTRCLPWLNTEQHPPQRTPQESEKFIARTPGKATSGRAANIPGDSRQSESTNVAPSSASAQAASSNKGRPFQGGTTATSAATLGSQQTANAVPGRKPRTGKASSPPKQLAKAIQSSTGQALHQAAQFLSHRGRSKAATNGAADVVHPGAGSGSAAAVHVAEFADSMTSDVIPSQSPSKALTKVVLGTSATTTGRQSFANRTVGRGSALHHHGPSPRPIGSDAVVPAAASRYLHGSPPHGSMQARHSTPSANHGHVLLSSSHVDWMRMMSMRALPHSRVAGRPAWDSSPMRGRPSALRGLKPVTREPWMVDEDVYNAAFERREVGVPERYLDPTARALRQEDRQQAYLNRFVDKHGEAEERERQRRAAQQHQERRPG